MAIKIALAGNPNSGKTTLFNTLTGSNQFVGNWPGVTVEKKEGKLKKHKDVTITDLPGIYSLSPYSLEEVIARNYLLTEKPDCIVNIVDGTNLERNLFLTTQLLELGTPMVVVVNMMDVVKKEGDSVDISKLEKSIGCPVIAISALKNTGIDDAINAMLEAVNSKKLPSSPLRFSTDVESALAGITAMIGSDVSEKMKRYYAIKVFERDKKFAESYKLDGAESVISAVEKSMDDNSESIITEERYGFITDFIDTVQKKTSAGRASRSDKIDRIVTNRFLAFPIFAAVMFFVYYISVTTVGTWVTDWTNDGLFGDGWHLTDRKSTRLNSSH